MVFQDTERRAQEVYGEVDSDSMIAYLAEKFKTEFKKYGVECSAFQEKKDPMTEKRPSRGFITLATTNGHGLERLTAEEIKKMIYSSCVERGALVSTEGDSIYSWEKETGFSHMRVMGDESAEKAGRKCPEAGSQSDYTIWVR